VLVIEVRVNGQLKITCGASDLRQLAAFIAITSPGTPGDAACRIECAGVRPIEPGTEEVLKWVNARIHVGDDVSFRIVEADTAEEPIDRQKISARDRGRDA
jgi:hypothetical protein